MVVSGISKTSHAISKRTINFVEFTFHHIKISKVLLGVSTSSTKYCFISVRHCTKFLLTRNEWKFFKVSFYTLLEVPLPKRNEVDLVQLWPSFESLAPLPSTFIAQWLYNWFKTFFKLETIFMIYITHEPKLQYFHLIMGIKHINDKQQGVNFLKVSQILIIFRLILITMVLNKILSLSQYSVKQL